MKSRRSAYVASGLSLTCVLGLCLALGRALPGILDNDYLRIGFHHTVFLELGRQVPAALVDALVFVGVVGVVLVLVPWLAGVGARWLCGHQELGVAEVRPRLLRVLLALSVVGIGHFFLSRFAPTVGGHPATPLAELLALFLLAGLLGRPAVARLGTWLSRLLFSPRAIVALGAPSLAVLLLLPPVANLAGKRRAAGRASVLLLVVDTLRADHLGVYGAPPDRTPHLDRFAQGAIVFRDSLSQASTTINSAPAILGSLYPTEHGYIDDYQCISNKILMLAETLREAGFRTVGISTNPHVSRRSGLAQGFETFIEDGAWRGTTAAAANRSFLSWLESNGDQPFFAMLWYIDPHLPYAPPPSYASRFVPAQLAHLVSPRTASPGYYQLSPQEQEVTRALYSAEVAYFDDQLGELLSRLKQAGRLEDTLVVLTADHGEGFWERVDPTGQPIHGHGYSLDRQETEVPLIVALPGRRRRGVVQTRASSIDVAPTVLDILGIPRTPSIEGLWRGRSLLPEIEGRAGPSPRYTFLELKTSQLGGTLIRAVVDEERKLVVTRGYQGLVLDPPRVELLDRRAGEQPLPGQERAPRSRAMFDALAEWEKGLRPFASHRAEVPPEEEQSLRERLRALGYLR